MPLLKQGKPIKDLWRHVPDEGAVPATGAVTVSFERWQGERETLLARQDPIGVRLDSGHTVDALARDLNRLALVALAFPAFTDGRAYTHARRLRERYAYKGEVRAVGNVLRDQYLFMQRCGFDTLEVLDGETEKGWKKATQAFSAFYQPAADDTPTILSLRHR